MVAMPRIKASEEGKIPEKGGPSIMEKKEKFFLMRKFFRILKLAGKSIRLIPAMGSRALWVIGFIGLRLAGSLMIGPGFF